MARKYGELTREVKNMAVMFVRTNGEFPKVSDVLASLPHLKERRHGVEKAVSTLRSRWKVGKLFNEIKLEAPPRSQFGNDVEGMTKRAYWYLQIMDATVENTGGSSVPVKEFDTLARLIRDLETWRKEDDGAKGEVAHARPSMETIVKRAFAIEQDQKRRKKKGA